MMPRLSGVVEAVSACSAMAVLCGVFVLRGRFVLIKAPCLAWLTTRLKPLFGRGLLGLWDVFEHAASWGERKAYNLLFLSGMIMATSAAPGKNM